MKKLTSYIVFFVIINVILSLIVYLTESPHNFPYGLLNPFRMDGLLFFYLPPLAACISYNKSRKFIILPYIIAIVVPFMYGAILGGDAGYIVFSIPITLVIITVALIIGAISGKYLNKDQTI